MGRSLFCPLLCLALVHLTLGSRSGIATVAVLARATASRVGECDACLSGFRNVKYNELNDMAMVVQNNVCPLTAPGQKCENFAAATLPTLLQWLHEPTTAWQFCTAGGACSAADRTKLQATSSAQPQVKDATQCALCKLVVSQVQMILNSSAVMDKLNATAQQVCVTLPPDMATVCSDFVNKYEPLVASLIANASPEELCEMLGVCVKPPSAWTEVASKLVALVKAQAPGMLKDSCDMCKMAVIEAHSLVANPQVQASMTNYTEALCEGFPSFTDTCKLYVDTYAPVVYSVLLSYLVPDTVCVEIGVCPPPTKLQTLASQLLDMLSPLKAALGTQAQANQMVTQHMAGAAARWAAAAKDQAAQAAEK